MVLPVRRYVTVEMAPVVTLRLELVFVFLGGLEKIAEHVCISFVSSSKKGLSREGGGCVTVLPYKFFLCTLVPHKYFTISLVPPSYMFSYSLLKIDKHFEEPNKV